MENRSRVGDIRKKFEGLNALEGKKDDILRNCQASLDHCLTKPDLTSQKPSHMCIERQFSNSSNPGNKSIVKRSHAFRSDRQVQSKYTNTNCVDNESNISSSCKTPTLINKNESRDITNSYKQNFKLNSVDSGKACFNDNKIQKHNIPIKNVTAETLQVPTSITDIDIPVQPNYSIVLKPKKKTLTKNSQKSSISHQNENKKQEVIINKSLSNRPISKPMTNYHIPNSFNESIGKIKPNTSFHQVKSIFENNQVEYPSDYNHKTKRNMCRNSVNEILKSPLPQGPPPKKPPRTFAHNTESNCLQSKENCVSDSEISTENKKSKSDIGKNNDLIDKSLFRPVRSKTESQIMLKKIEYALLNKQHHVISPTLLKESNKDEIESPTKNNDFVLKTNHSKWQTRLNRPNTSLEHVQISKNIQTENSSLCFSALNCSNSGKSIESNIYDTPFEPKSKFFIEKSSESTMSGTIDLMNANYNNYTNKFGKNTTNEEHIYAEPCDKRKSKSVCKRPADIGFIKNYENKLPVTLKKNNDIKLTNCEFNSSNQSNSGLHYMSTPILNKERTDKSDSAKRNQSSQFIAEAINTHVLNNQNDIHNIPSFLDKQKIQMMVNEAYGTCLNRPISGGSDSDSVASTPDDGPSKSSIHHGSCTSPDYESKERELEREQKTAERKGYLKRVCSRGKSFHRPASISDASSNPHLYEFLLLIGLDLDPARCKVPYIKSKYPPGITVPNGIESLCFPDASDWPPQGCKDDLLMGGCYCIVLTNSNGIRKYGYCRRVQPEGAAICLPLAYCIVSAFKNNWLFNRILIELEAQHGQSEQNLTNYFEELYKNPYPAPGQSVLITQPSTGKKVEVVRRLVDPRQEELDIARLLSVVRLSIFLQLFGTLLLERKIVLLSYSISKLSACVEGLQATLYPFHWQHTLVPVVPSNMIDLCDAPTPYIIGLLKKKNSCVDPFLGISDFDQVLIVDVDDNKILRSMGDEDSVLPSRLYRGLKTALQLAVTDCINSLFTNASLIASEALIRLFVELIGHYRDHILTSTETGKREFQRENFVKSVSSVTKQNFLDWFTETAMFTAFIEERLDRSINPRGEFEQQCVQYLSDRSQPSFLKNYKAIIKTGKTLGDRFKDWASSS